MARIEKQIRLAMALKEALLDAYDPEAIILFGSLGRGDADEFSDIDLLLVMETDRDAKELSEEMTEYLSPLSEDKHIFGQITKRIINRGIFSVKETSRGLLSSRPSKKVKFFLKKPYGAGRLCPSIPMTRGKRRSSARNTADRPMISWPWPNPPFKKAPSFGAGTSPGLPQ